MVVIKRTVCKLHRAAVGFISNVKLCFSLGRCGGLDIRKIMGASRTGGGETVHFNAKHRAVVQDKA